MNLFWKKIFRVLIPTRRYERRETDFLAASEIYKSDPQQTFRKKKNRPHRKAYLSFSDDFYWSSMEESAWNSGFYFQNKNRLQHYSFHNEKQANNKGLNTSGNKGVLRIQTKKERIESLTWHPEKGFIKKTFGFSSDVLQTAKSFKQKEGVFKAKLRSSGNIHHAFWLSTEVLKPHINIFYFNGLSIEVGYSYDGKLYRTEIDGINPSDFYIYTLEWTQQELIWYINNVEILRAPNNIQDVEMFLNFNSFIPQKMEGEEGVLEVDWVRVYQFL